jgi:hypothetical protein
MMLRQNFLGGKSQVKRKQDSIQFKRESNQSPHKYDLKVLTTKLWPYLSSFALSVTWLTVSTYVNWKSNKSASSIFATSHGHIHDICDKFLICTCYRLNFCRVFIISCQMYLFSTGIIYTGVLPRRFLFHYIGHSSFRQWKQCRPWFQGFLEKGSRISSPSH